MLNFDLKKKKWFNLVIVDRSVFHMIYELHEIKGEKSVVNQRNM